MAESDRTRARATQVEDRAPATRRRSPQADHPLLGLQRAAGNSAVVAMLDAESKVRGDEEERETESAEGGGPETATENASAAEGGDGGGGESEGSESETTEEGGETVASEGGDGGSTGESEGEGAESEGEEGGQIVTGTISAGELGEAETESWGPPSGVVADRHDARTDARKAGTPDARPAARTARPAPAGPQEYRLDVDFGVNTSIQQASLGSLQRNDGITAHPNVKVTIQGGAAVNAFGAMTPTHSFSNLAFKAKTGFFKGNYIQLKFNVDVLCSWGVNDGGKTDIPSGTSGAITASNYEQIVSDLTPIKREKSWVAPRTQFFSSAIVARHEQYHATDERDWVKGQGAKQLVAWLQNQVVVLDETQRADATAIAAEIRPIMTAARNMLSNASDAYYSGPSGTTYYSRPGEERAFGDGKQPYLSLAAAVKTRGEALKAAAAKKTT